MGEDIWCAGCEGSPGEGDEVRGWFHFVGRNAVCEVLGNFGRAKAVCLQLYSFMEDVINIVAIAIL